MAAHVYVCLALAALLTPADVFGNVPHDAQHVQPPAGRLPAVRVARHEVTCQTQPGRAEPAWWDLGLPKCLAS